MRRILAIAAIAAMSATSAIAATIEISGITAKWVNATGATVSGLNTETISWGGGTNKSSYNFTPLATSFFPASSPFDIGTFTHNNQPISPPAITGASLQLDIVGNVDSVAFSMGGVFLFSHLETSNSLPCDETPTSVSKCDDLVTFEGATSLYGDKIVVGGEEFVFALAGFEKGLTFLTEEGKSNSAILQATFTRDPIINQDPDPVPLPAAGFLLLTALGGLRLAKRRKT